MAQRKGGKKALTRQAARVDQLWRQSIQLADAGKPVEQERALRAILELAPDHFHSLLKLAYMAQGAGKKPIALDYARRAVQANFADAQGHFVLGQVLAELGLTELAEAELVIAEQLDPTDARILDVLGWVLAQQGRSADALLVFRRAIALAPDAISFYFSLASNKKFHPGDPDITNIEKLREHACDRSQHDETILNFALAKVYHDCGEYDRAFAEMQQGNRRQRKEVQYSSEARRELTTSVIETMDAGFVERLEGKGYAEDGPVFVVGMARSGTTLLESLLARHPQVAGIGEVSYIKNLAEGCGQQLDSPLSFPHILAELTPQLCQVLGEQYVRLTRQFGVGAQRIVDKSLDNDLFVGLIFALLPKAKIIHCERNPVDTCLSVYQQFFTSGMHYSYSQKDIGEYYVQYRRLMNHWQDLFPGRILNVAYEDVVADSEQAQRRMIEFCDLSWDERCLQQPGADVKIRTASVWQARQPVHGNSVKRWRHYEKHLGPLLEALRPVLVDGTY